MALQLIDGSVKLFLVFIQYFNYKSAGIKTKLIKLKAVSNKRFETVASYIVETLKKKGIDHKYVCFSGDNTKICNVYILQTLLCFIFIIPLV